VQTLNHAQSLSTQYVGVLLSPEKKSCFCVKMTRFDACFTFILVRPLTTFLFGVRFTLLVIKLWIEFRLRKSKSSCTIGLRQRWFFIMSFSRYGNVRMWFIAGITTLLALSVYQIIVNNTLPTTSDAIPLLGQSFVAESLSYRIKLLSCIENSNSSSSFNSGVYST